MQAAEELALDPLHGLWRHDAVGPSNVVFEKDAAGLADGEGHGGVGVECYVVAEENVGGIVGNLGDGGGIFEELDEISFELERTEESLHQLLAGGSDLKGSRCRGTVPEAAAAAVLQVASPS